MNVRANMCLQAAQPKWGEGWKRPSPAMREAFVSRELVLLALGQDEGTRKRFPVLFSKTFSKISDRRWEASSNERI